MKYLNTFNENRTIDNKVLVVGIKWNGEVVSFDKIKAYVHIYKVSDKEQRDIPYRGKTLKGTHRIKEIVDINGEKYAAGIDINGDLFAVNKDMYGYAVDKKGLRITSTQGNLVQQWNINDNYLDTIWGGKLLVSPLPTGHVNLKVDNELIKRVRRFSKKLEPDIELIPLESFKYKLNLLTINEFKSEGNLQQKLSIIILLKYLLEIKDQFDPTSAGFIFESFIGGLMENGVVSADNSQFDVIMKGNKSFQVKLYGDSGYIKVNNKEERKSDYYVLGIKEYNVVKIFILPRAVVFGENGFSKTYSTTSGMSISRLLNDFNELEKKNEAYRLDLNGLDDKIEDIGVGLRDELGIIFNKISEIEYGVETILTGVDKNNKIIDLSDMEKISKESEKTATSLADDISVLANRIINI